MSTPPSPEDLHPALVEFLKLNKIDMAILLYPGGDLCETVSICYQISPEDAARVMEECLEDMKGGDAQVVLDVRDN